MSAKITELLNKVEANAEVIIKTKTNLKKCPKSRLTKGYIETRIQLTQEYWQKYLASYTILCEAVPSHEKCTISYFANDEFDKIEELYLCLIGDMKDMLTSTQDETKSNAVNMNVNHEGQSRSCLAKLPKIQLPSFSGKYEEWPAFQDMFTSLIHTNSSITKVQKLHYLKSSITGEAETLLRHIPITEDNYDHGWDILTSRYGNKRLIVFSSMKRLFGQKKIIGSHANQIKSLLDVTAECLNSLKNQNVSTESWDPMLIYLIVQRLDHETHKDWEMHSLKECGEELPTWSLMKKFLESKYRTFELIAPSTAAYAPTRDRVQQVHHVSATENYNVKCPLCDDNHRLCYCKQFGQMDPEKRNEYVKSKFICFNCLLPGHSIKICRRPSSCKICQKRHHSLLHVSRSTKDTSGTSCHQAQPEVAAHIHVEEEEVQVNTVMTPTVSNTPTYKVALLATALVTVRSEEGHTNVLRALIDPGAQGSFITERAAQLLKTRRYPIKGNIVGVGSTTMSLKQVVQVEVSSRSEEFSLKVRAYVLNNQLTTSLPSKTIKSQNWYHIEGLELADKEYFKPGRIDMLLGVEEYAQIIKDNILKGPPGAPCAQSTTLGWILFGGIQQDDENVEPKLIMHHALDVEDLLKTFWEVDTNAKRQLTKEEEECEKIYNETHTRNAEGRYVVKLPFKTEEPKSKKGNTKDTALKRFHQLERKFDKTPALKEAYKEVIDEYITMGHMTLVPEDELNNPAVYLPHHAVVREEKETTKTRVVFDASSKGTNGISLNDELMTGPILQEDLRSIIMRWRMHKICFTSDIQKMYRMILLQKEDTDYHRILWRRDDKEEIREYRLQTVTFGTACAPYLAIKTLKQVAIDEGDKFPEAAKIINNNFYVDDLMSGKDTVSEAVQVKNQIQEILNKGMFHLQKWSSNSPEFLRNVDPKDRTMKASLDINIDGIVKALGVSWNLRTDEFEYSISLPPISPVITKRTILADLQKLFDPMGWIAPVLVRAKILIQQLWLSGKGWDDQVPEEIETEWIMLREDFDKVKEIKVKRWVNTLTKDTDNITLHGFCDASINAYAAVVYCRVVDKDGTVKVEVVAAKTKVAPVKTVSLPRLELCGALLLSKLLRQIYEAMRIPPRHVYAWSDSSVVLAWLNGSPNRWKPFVANRVVEILDNLNSSQWHHVTSENNAADVGSRGCTVTEIKTNQLWWKGPSWLLDKTIKFAKITNTSTELEKREKVKVVMNIVEEDKKHEILNSENYDSIIEQLKTIVYCKRVLNYAKSRKEGPITTNDLEEALKLSIKYVQKQTFEEDIEDIERHRYVKSKSKLKSLNPYLDSEHILRVGGRLHNANLSDNAKHPVILDNKNPLTLLIVADAHQKTMHGGLQMMMGYLRTRYWIIRAKSVVKNYLHRCVICARLKAKTKTQIMGNLPDVRVTPARPFLHSGVDFAGPYNILMSKGRGTKLSKAYVAIFVCMAVKAVHLELVSDLSAEAFIAAFKRFVSRRGRCAHLWSDQGRNFIAANKELTNEWKEAKLEFQGNIEGQLAQDGTQWHFIPPYSPNFGGLWEAGVRSMKHHLKRVINRHLTYEELSTLLCQVEACLNSRPLSPIDDTDIDNINALTPAHFLIGEPTITVPAPDTSNINMSNLARWQYTQKILMNFWKRWQHEYLSRLQQRPKWLKTQAEFEIGDIVLVKQDGMSPGKWLLGRVTAKHPGADGATRVYSVKSGNSVTKRCITKLCYLPIDQD